MPSFKAIALAAVTFVASTYAQYTIDPNSVDLATRTKWCDSQQAACPLLCTQLPGGSLSTASNTCDPASLGFTCICANGISPNATEYSQTIPYFICVQWGSQCVANCGATNTACQSSCRQDHPCGAQDPTLYNITSTSSTVNPTAAATTTATDGSATTGAAATGTVFNGLGGGAATTSAAGSTPTKSGAQAAMDIGRSCGALIVGATFFAGLALL